MAESHAENDVSGTAQGPVIQTGNLHGDIYLGVSAESLEYLAPGVIQIRLSKSSPHDAATSLAKLDPRKAADVILLIQEGRRIEIMAAMDSASAAAIVNLLDDETATVLRSAIRAAHAIATDAARWHGVLGDASGDLARRERSPRGTKGYASHYERGTVYWAERTGTGMVAGPIKKRFWELDGLSGRLGYPIGGETKAAKSRFGTTGSFQRFESTWDYADEAISKTDTVCGATIYASDKGVFTTWGGIGQYFEASGGTWGPLGFPLSEEQQLVEEDPYDDVERCRQRFEGGTVYWSEQTGVACVQPPIQDSYEFFWHEYGLPVGDQFVAAPSRQGISGIVQRFYDWTLIYSSVELGTWAVAGTVLAYFEESGATSGPYGFPAGPVGPSPCDDVSREQKFETGVIIMPWRGGAVGVAGQVCEAWLAHREDLGIPTAPERTIGGGPDLIQTFERGVITVISGVARHWVAPPAPTGAGAEP